MNRESKDERENDDELQCSVSEIAVDRKKELAEKHKKRIEIMRNQLKERKRPGHETVSFCQLFSPLTEHPGSVGSVGAGVGKWGGWVSAAVNAKMWQTGSIKLA